MPRITGQLVSLRAQYSLQRTTRQMQTAMERLSSGLRINRASDDPAGLISSELLNDQAEALTPAIDQAQRAGNLVATADGGLAQVSDLLLSIQQLVTQAANSGGMSDQEIHANQVQLDAAVDSIRRLTQTTTFAGRRLLDGSLDYRASGVDPTRIAGLAVHRSNLGAASYLPVRVDVAVAAQPARAQFLTSQVGSATSLRITGNQGRQTFNFAAGTAASAILFAVNFEADNTGVSATLLSPGHPASGIQFTSRLSGADSLVSVEPLNGSFPLVNIAGVAGSYSINGMPANAHGSELSLYSPGLELTVKLAGGFIAGATSFALTGGGALFPVGPSLVSDLASVGISSVDPDSLGNGDVGFLSELATGGAKSLVSGGTAQASQVVSAAIDQVSSLRGRLGSFASSTLDQGVNSLNDMLLNVKTNESAIRDADFAAESSNLARTQLLAQVSTSVMAMANSSRDNILRLLA